MSDYPHSYYNAKYIAETWGWVPTPPLIFAIRAVELEEEPWVFNELPLGIKDGDLWPS